MIDRILKELAPSQAEAALIAERLDRLVELKLQGKPTAVVEATIKNVLAEIALRNDADVRQRVRDILNGGTQLLISVLAD